MDATRENPLTESDWNLTAQSALVRSKIDSERWAWDFSSKNGIELVTLHPPTILGPGFHRYTTSTKIYELILLGKLPPLPEGGCHLVDVRDLAEAHVRAFSNQNCSGRYIVAGQFFKISEFMVFLRALNLGLKVPGFQSPRWALQGVRAVDWMLHQVSGRPRQLTGELIRDFVGKHQHVSTVKAVRDLGWSPRPAQETILDTFQWIRENFLNKEYSK
jgi:dihydroflavonol-4-reductase